MERSRCLTSWACCRWPRSTALQGLVGQVYSRVVSALKWAFADCDEISGDDHRGLRENRSKKPKQARSGAVMRQEAEL
jgi:hypothetical protein